jgi:hypothetical protein
MMKEELIHQKVVVSTRCNTVSESKVLKRYPYLFGKDCTRRPSRSQIKQMVNTEDKK